ncbi:MAG: hypothetical protein LN413_00655 [Candidatus Thermoplasmatota archaeon]|nr:hypothetical protein [Candidatus Thermoplasmatota archaeon]
MAVCKECQEKCEKCGNPIVPSDVPCIPYVWPDNSTTPNPNVVVTFTTDNPGVVSGTNNLSTRLEEEDCPKCAGSGKIKVYRTYMNGVPVDTMGTADNSTFFALSGE